MADSPTTVRASIPPTIDDNLRADTSSVTRIMDFWRKSNDADILQALEEFPSLIENKSLLIELAIKDYQRKRQDAPLEIRQYCEGFQQFGSSVEHSIFRALEVQEYFEAHPEILDLVNHFAWPADGDTIQGFQVVEELGRGSLARVYLCQESGVGGREVVVKVARGGEYEAAILGRLDHPNIVPIYSVTNDPNGAASYICMPYRGRSTLLDVVDNLKKRSAPPIGNEIILDVAKCSVVVRELDSRLHPGELPRHAPHGYVDSVIDLAAQLANALHHSHSMGIYHGDLKPSNVLLTPHAVPLLIDFNLATDRKFDAAPRGGTLAYMPPEQLAGVGGLVDERDVKYDARSEVYSFGALVYQLLTGDVPFRVDSEKQAPEAAAGKLLELQKSSCPSVRTRNRAVNISLERLILECLSLDPTRRPQTMLAVEGRLHSERRGLSRLRRFSAARPVAARSIAATLLLMAAAATTYLAMLPPYHEREFSKAIELRASGQLNDALTHFDRAVNSAPTNDVAAFERARTLILKEKYADARSEFGHLWDADPKLEYAANIAYCFNLERNHSAAIPWYELALDRGSNKPSVHSNLGLSYAQGRSRLGHLERFDRAEQHFQKAIELGGDSILIGVNRIRAGLVRFAADPHFQLRSLVPQLERLIEAAPEDAAVSKLAVNVYSQLSLTDKSFVERALDVIDHAIDVGVNPKPQLLATSPLYAAIRGNARFGDMHARASTSSVARITPPVVVFFDPTTTK